MSDRLFRMIDNYEIKLQLGANGRLSPEQIEDRVRRYAHAAAAEHVVYVQTRQILCSHGVQTMVFPYYHSFAREMGKLCRTEPSPAWRSRALATISAKWVARGLDEAVLLDIALNLFNLSPPDPESAPSSETPN